MFRVWRDDEQGASFWWILGLAGLAALLLVAPNQVVLTKYLNDVLIFLDGAYRVSLGQVPNRDFHSALGPLAFLIPAVGLWITGTLGTAMSVGMAVLILVLAPAIAHVLSSRMRPIIGLPFAAFLVLILAVPINIGEGIFDLSFGMFYNRIGWSAIGALLVMHLRPTAAARHQSAYDAAAAALLTLVMLYTKASYGVVAVGFLVLMLLDRRQRRWVGAALGIVLLAGLLIEVAWRGTANHIADLVAASQVSGRKTLEDYASALLRNFADYVLFCSIAGLSLWRRPSLGDVLFYGFCAVAGLLLMSQNYQVWGIITLHAGVAVAAERLLRTVGPEDAVQPVSAARAAPFLLLALLLPTIVHCTFALGLHATLASARAGQPFGPATYTGLRLAPSWHVSDYASNAQYLSTLREGTAILHSMEPKPRGVFVLDFVSPFASLAGLAPPTGDTAWQHWSRNVDETTFVPPEQLFREVEVVLEPKVAIEGVTGDNLRRIYGGYLAEHYVLAQETASWSVYRRKRGPALPAG